MGPRMLGPMFVILLLLLLPSLFLTTRSTLHRYFTQDQGHHPSSRLQESPADGESCWSTDDLYFVLDSSRSVNDNWEFTQSFVQDLVNRFKNPKQRMSFITYSTHGRINMKLTSNRKKINNALVELLNIRPSGAINMQHGLEKANEQIERTRAAGAKVPSLIIVLTGEQLLPESFAETQVEAAKSKQLGATLYFVGVQNYQLSQLLEIAGEEDHLFQVDSGYPGLEDIVDPLIARSCVQITSVDFSAICNRDTNEVKVIGKGFKNIQKDEVVCQFRLGKETARIEALSVQDTSITCPGPKLNNQGQRGPHMPYWMPYHQLPNDIPFHMLCRLSYDILTRMKSLPVQSSVSNLSTGLCLSWCCPFSCCSAVVSGDGALHVFRGHWERSASW
ncbi:anthrax toxin receptor-like isoform X5 [Manis javanica]|uniref:anthrax toxin receptor-like isoform X5 n=1 Tax=Manis javanica TaxID=9974 RepID=UPI003C6D2ED3